VLLPQALSRMEPSSKRTILTRKRSLRKRMGVFYLKLKFQSAQKAL
jgi:hypothetical protein